MEENITGEEIEEKFLEEKQIDTLQGIIIILLAIVILVVMYLKKRK